MPKITLGFLEANVWWWRKVQWKKPHNQFYLATPAGYLWREGDDRAAFNYELIRRHNHTKRFAPFFELPFAHMNFLRNGFADVQEVILPSRHNHNAEKVYEHGWTRGNPLLQWNLLLPDETLKNAFIFWIHQQRATQDIPRPTRKPGRIKPIPWSWLELLDCTHFKLRALNGGERHSLAEARKRAKTNSEAFMKGLEEFREQQKNPLRMTIDEDYSLEWGNPGFKSPPRMWKDIWPCEESNPK